MVDTNALPTGGRVVVTHAEGMMQAAIVQALINLAVNTALAPTKGIALPMISHGSSGLTMTLLQVGILIAIARVSEREMAEFERTVETTEGVG